MKIKKLLPFLPAILAILFTTSILANEQIEIEKFFDFDNTTPSRFSTISIKPFFQDLYYADYYQTRSPGRSKTSIFNQSLVCYVKEVYNSRHYSQLISQDGTHIVEFLELSSELNLDLQSLYTCTRLFYNKIKECELIDDTVIIQILKPLPYLLERYFEIEDHKLPSINHLSKNIEKALLFKFTDHLPEFQEAPNPFLTQLAQEIAQNTIKELDYYKKTIEKNTMLERLRQIIIRFFELALCKVMWDPVAYEGIWQSVITIANNLQLLGDHGIIDHMDDLDDLLWSLTHRFKFFLDLEGSSLPLTFYEEIESDLNGNVVPFLEAEEQDEGIKGKKAFIAEALIKAKAKAFAFEKRGLFTDQML